ncbi:MAG: hypothetical protein HY823_01885 [Acidobacteria bacterium]|nr:hypothetical protein [Acidobacteriota bacterium]
MSLLSLGARQAGVLWLEPNRLRAGNQHRVLEGLPTEDQLAQALSSLPQGPSLWILDDLWAPAALLRDIVEIPSGPEAQDAFFRWRFAQATALEGEHAVQALQVDAGVWLLAGLPQDLRDAWLALALRLGRPIHGLVPRWVWLYNRLAPSREAPGILLSLCPAGGGRFTGTLAAWGRSLTLLRQWREPAEVEIWHAERLLPTVAFLQREGRGPQDLWIWGASKWPESALPSHLIQPEIPSTEAL